jgi:hypothetical protein
MKTNFIKCFLAILILALISSGCGLVNISFTNPTSIFPTQKSFSTFIPTTPVPYSPIPPSPTSQPTSTPLPTSLPTFTPLPISLPTLTPLPAGIVRISFAAGATSGVAQGQLQATQIKTFILRAMQSQPMMVAVNSQNSDVTLAIQGYQDGRVLLPASNRYSTWQTILPVTEDYLIQVIGGASTENFYLSVNIPSRIIFASGATSATVSGPTPGGFAVIYVLRASGGQTMSVVLQVPQDSGALSIYGYSDGQPMVRSVMNQTAFTTKLPSTQDYIIEVVPFYGHVINYSMTVMVK